MTIVTYTAVDRGSLTTDHYAGNPYTIDFAAQAIDLAQKRNITSRTSLSGKTETIRHRKDVIWSISTDLIPEAELPLWLEFLDSVDGGESFSLDLYGTANPVSVILQDDPTISRVNATMNYLISFKAIEVQ